MVPRHYMNQCWNIVHLTLRNKLQWNRMRNSNISFQWIVLWNLVCKAAVILRRPQCVNVYKDFLNQWQYDIYGVLTYMTPGIHFRIRTQSPTSQFRADQHYYQIRSNAICREKLLVVSHVEEHSCELIRGNFILTLHVRGTSYLGLNRSILWLLMPWLLTSPGHQQPWYWLCRICRSWSYLRKDFKYLCQINVE